jgi:titin
MASRPLRRTLALVATGTAVLAPLSLGVAPASADTDSFYFSTDDGATSSGPVPDTVCAIRWSLTGGGGGAANGGQDGLVGPGGGGGLLQVVTEVRAGQVFQLWPGTMGGDSGSGGDPGRNGLGEDGQPGHYVIEENRFGGGGGAASTVTLGTNVVYLTTHGGNGGGGDYGGSGFFPPGPGSAAVRTHLDHGMATIPSNGVITGHGVECEEPNAPVGAHVHTLNGGAWVSFLPGDTKNLQGHHLAEVTHYEIQVDDGPWTTFPMTFTSLEEGGWTGTVDGLTNGRQYTLSFRAASAVGPSQATEPITVTPAGKHVKPPIDVPQVTAPPVTAPPVTAPPVTAPPVTAPPVTAPPVTAPPVTAPPVTTPPVTTPPVTTPPVTTPPVTGVPAPAPATATAAVSSVQVGWTRLTDRPTVLGYRAIATPDDGGAPISCDTGPAAASCLLGAVAGTRYAVTVTALTGTGPGAATDPIRTGPVLAPGVAERAPAGTTTLTTDQGQISTAQPGQQITVMGTGFLPHSTVTVTIYSDPVVLGTAVTDANGNFSLPVTVPASLAAGQHSLVAAGVDPAGAIRTLRLDVTVPSPAKPAGPELAYTGADLTVPLSIGAASLVLGGVLLRVNRRRSPHTTPV